MYGSVCSGIEAATVAWHPLGWSPAWFAEIDPFCCALLTHHYPTVENCGDFTEIERSEPIDLLVGGTPCQSFSVAGKRAGLDDPRGNLTLEFLALADRLRPRWLVWENVPGVMSDDGGRTFGTVLGILGKLGYGFAYRVLDAQYFGVPQRRRRVFVVGYLGDWRRAAAVLFERSSLRGDPPPSRETGKDIAGSLGGGSGERGWCDDTDRMTFVAETAASTLNAHYGQKWGLENQHIDQGAPMFVTHSLRADGFDASEDGTGRGTPLVTHDVVGPLCADAATARKHGDGGLTSIQHMLSGYIQPVAFDYKQSGEVNPTMRSLSHDKSHANNGSHLAVATFDERNITSKRNRSRVEAGAPCHTLHADAPAIAFTERTRADGRNLETQEEVAYALCNPGSGGRTHSRQLMHRSAVRRLTPRECERLQGFPDDYTLIPYRGKPASDGPRYRALGNSFAVPVVRWIGRRIQMVEDLRRAEERQQA